MRSQLRSWVSWPTEALLPGPDTSSIRKWGAWLGSFVLGLILGAASCQSVGKGLFTLSERASLFEVTAVWAAASFLPLVFFGLLLPRIAGPLIVVASLVVTVCSIPGSGFNIGIVLVAALWSFATGAVGLGFIWSGLRPEQGQ